MIFIWYKVKCITHTLRVPEKDAEWNHEHHSSHQHAKMHNSLPVSARAGCRMDVKPWAPFQSPTCQNAQLTNYECQRRMQDGHETMRTLSLGLRIAYLTSTCGNQYESWYNLLWISLYAGVAVLAMPSTVRIKLCSDEMCQTIEDKEIHKGILSCCILDTKC